MTINFKFTGTEPDDTLRMYAETKVASFAKMLGKKDVDAAVCVIEFRRSTKHQTGDVCTAEVTLEVGGKIYRVAKDEPTFEKAIDKVKDDVLQSLRADKEKSESFIKRGGRVLKKMLRRESTENIA